MSSQEPLWHYTDGTNVFGPFDISAIRQLANAGVIRPEHLLAREGDNAWRSLTEAMLGASQPINQQPAVPLAVPGQNGSEGDSGVIVITVIIAILAVVALFVHPPSILLLVALAFVRLVKWAWSKL